MITIYLIGVGIMIIVYLATHEGKITGVDWSDVLLVIAWPITLMFFLYYLFYEENK